MSVEELRLRYVDDERCTPGSRSLLRPRRCSAGSTQTVGVVEAIDDHSCVLVTGSDSVETVAAYVGMLGLEFTVTDPPELVEALRVVSERYARAIG